MKWNEREHEIFGGITIRQQVQEFAAVFAVAFVILADVWIYYFGLTEEVAVLLATTCLFLIFGLQRPRLIYPLWQLWLALVEVLIKIMTWFILLLVWIVVITPLSYLRKILKINKLDLSYKTSEESYWKKKSKKENDFSLMKKMY